MPVEIREAEGSELPRILELTTTAFDASEGKDISDLISALLTDRTAAPILLLVAIKDGTVVGHVLFTQARLDTLPTISASILAPLAVHPNHQKQGIGGQLICKGLEKLKASGVQLVFVLGYPSYYTKHGFAPAGVQGLGATYPIAAENSDAWMVQALHPGVLGVVKGRVICADALNDPKYWVE